MNFSLSDEQKDIQTLASQILSEQVTADTLHKYDMWQEERFSRTLWSQLADAGLLGIAIPETNGGMGFGFSELSLLIEECGRVLAPVPVIPSLISALAIDKFGNAETKKLLNGAATGELILSAAFHEEGIFDAYTPNTKASSGKLSGTKMCVPYANFATRLLVVADDKSEASLFLVDPKDSSVTLTALKATTFEPQFIVELNNTPAIKLGGATAVQFLVERYTAALCAYQAGAAEQMVKMTAAYTSEREQFNVKIASFQAVGHRVANCYIDAKCLKLVTQQAVELLAENADASREVHVAKVWLGDACHRISYATQHLHGGMGVDRDYPLWRYSLWAKQNELTLGSSTQHTLTLGDLIAAGSYDID